MKQQNEVKCKEQETIKTSQEVLKKNLAKLLQMKNVSNNLKICNGLNNTAKIRMTDLEKRCDKITENVFQKEKDGKYE